MAIELCIALLGAGLSGIRGRGAPFVPGFGTPKQIGRLFLTDYLFTFEVASLLLLVAAVGAVVLARRRRGLDAEEAQDVEFQRRLHQPRPEFTGSMAESAGLRPAIREIEESGPATIEREPAPTTTTTGER